MRLPHCGFLCVYVSSVSLACVCVCVLECVCGDHLLTGLSAPHKATSIWKDFQLLGTDFLNPSSPLTGSSAMGVEVWELWGVTF